MELNPKQPEFVLATSNYSKKVYMKYNIAHFYQFTAEANHMGVIPDACVDILFEKRNEKLIGRVAGTRFEKSEAPTEINSEYFGIRFMPGYNPFNKHIKQSELVNNEETLDSLLNYYDDKEQLLETMFYAGTFEKKVSIFINYYHKNFKEITEDKYSLKYMIRNKIIQSNSDIKLSELTAYTGYSERYLNQKIHEEFGINPKSLIRFIRFQQSLSNLISNINQPSNGQASLMSGYYDQSHFIKEFKKLSGLTPSGYLRNLLTHSYEQKLHILD